MSRGTKQTCGALMRVLFLASYFPRPSKPQIGTWALEQAKALARVSDLQAICCTSYVPGIFRIVAKARPWIDIPPTHQWENVSTTYFKALYYPVQPLKRWAYPAPKRQMNIAWNSVRSRLLAAVKSFAPEGILAHHTAVNGFFAERIHQLTGIPYVVSDYDFAEVADCEKFPRRREFFDRVIRSATASICAAKRMERDMLRIFPHARATTIHQAIWPHPTEIFKTPRVPELQGKTIIFSAGMFVPRKGFLLLIKAFAQIAPKYPNALLRIGGDGPQRPEIEALIQELKLSDRVQLLGLLPHKQIFQEMAWSDLFALVSWDEPFATVFLEAMAAGKPIVTASDGGINDVVVDGIHGKVVPPKDLPAVIQALDDLLANPESRIVMGQNARAMIQERLTWDITSRSIIQLFQQRSAPWNG
jgi:glycosyltransferase involved in cell wall biosynthesis